jgi:hypothetical protein
VTGSERYWRKVRHYNRRTLPAGKDRQVKWTKAEDELLLKRWDRYTWTQRTDLAIRLDRSLIACVRHAVILHRREREREREARARLLFTFGSCTGML